MMYNVLQDIACLLWIVLAVMMFVELRRWNKRFSELYDALKEQIEDGAAHAPD